MSTTPSPGYNPGHEVTPFVRWAYRLRWPLALAFIAATFAVMGAGWGRIEHFSAEVNQLADHPAESPKPQMFDPRSDIWFDPGDEALWAYRVIEEQFIAEDLVFVAFEETQDPDGVFGVKPLQTIMRLTTAISQIPYVRNVRSLTENPWIRWGQAGPDEEGLIVSDLFDDPPSEYSENERIVRMVAILGAQHASDLIGEDKVRAVLGPGEHLSDYIGEPRLLRGVVSEDGRTTALQVQILRPKIPEDKLDAVFGDSSDRKIGPAIHTTSSQTHVVAAINDILAKEKEYDFHLVGVPVLEKHFPDVGEADMKFVGLMFLVIGIVLLAVYRRIAGMLLPLGVVLVTIFAMNGTVWAAGDLMNNLTAIGPNIITAVGIADAVHLVSAYYILRPMHTNRTELIHHVLRRNALPVFLTSVTTMVGFLSLTTSPIIPMKMLGYTAGLGTAYAYLLSMTIVPAVLSLLPLKPKLDEHGKALRHAEKEHWSEGLVRRVFQLRRPLAVSTIVLIVLSAIGLSRIELTTDMREMFPKNDPVRTDMHWVSERLGGAGDLELVFYGPQASEDDAKVTARQTKIAALQMRQADPESGGLSAAEKKQLAEMLTADTAERRKHIGAYEPFLAKADAFQRELEKEAKTDSPLQILTNFDSALSVLRKIHQVQNENKAAFYRVPTEADVPASARKPSVIVDDVLDERIYVPAQDASSLISQYYLQYENGAKPTENLSALLTPDRTVFRISARIDAAPTTFTLAAFDRIREIARKHFPQRAGTKEQVEAGKALSSLTLTGKQYLFTNMMDRFTNTLIISFSLALAVIVLLITIAFRSVRLGLASLVPNVLPIAAPLGFLGLTGIPIDGPAILVASVALGVCVDDTIHLFAKFSQARGDGLSVADSLERSFRLVGGALTWTSVVLVIGFGTLAFSSFKPNAAIGYMGSLMIALAWFADFVLTPAVLGYLFREKKTS